MDLNQLAQISKGRLIGESINFEGFSIDSRTIGPGELYISLLGKNFDGHEFISEAIAKGAAALVVNKSIQSDVPQILVENTYEFIKQVALFNRKQFTGKMIGITGTLFAYFSILILNFGDFSRYVKNSQELLKGNLSLLISTIIYSFLFFTSLHLGAHRLSLPSLLKITTKCYLAHGNHPMKRCPRELLGCC